MKITTEKLGKGKTKVIVSTNEYEVTGRIIVSKSAGKAVEYLENSSGDKAKEFNEAVAKAESIDGGVEVIQTVPDVSVETDLDLHMPSYPPTRKTGITQHVRDAFLLGCETPTQVLAYLDDAGISYITNSVYTILWSIRKEAGLPPLNRKQK